MSSKKLTNKQLREKQFLEEKIFQKHLIVGFSLLSLVVITFLILFAYWCDTKYVYRKFILYGEEISGELVCMHDNNLQYHESSKIVKENKVFYVCSSKCQEHLNKHFQKVAYATDAFSGDTICKADAIIGLKDRGSPDMVYFKNRQNFKKYYEQRIK